MSRSNKLLRIRVSIHIPERDEWRIEISLPSAQFDRPAKLWIQSENFLIIIRILQWLIIFKCSRLFQLSSPGRDGEKLLLQYGSNEDGRPVWIAYEGMWDDSSSTFQARQAVFKTEDTSNVLTEQGVHYWQMNESASKEAVADGQPHWQGSLCCTTKNVVRVRPNLPWTDWLSDVCHDVSQVLVRFLLKSRLMTVWWNNDCPLCDMTCWSLRSQLALTVQWNDCPLCVTWFPLPVTWITAWFLEQDMKFADAEPNFDELQNIHIDLSNIMCRSYFHCCSPAVPLPSVTKHCWPIPNQVQQMSNSAGNLNCLSPPAKRPDADILLT